MALSLINQLVALARQVNNTLVVDTDVNHYATSKPHSMHMVNSGLDVEFRISPGCNGPG